MATELDALSPVRVKVTLSTGTEVELLDLKARQFFKLLKIITNGPASALIGASSDLLQGTEEQLMYKLAGYLVVSIPNTYDEALDFITSMIQPAGLREANKLNEKAAREHNSELWLALAKDMANPEVEDLVNLIEAIVRNEAADLISLGKKVMNLINLAQKTGQLPSSQKSQDKSTSARSRKSLTS